MNYLTCRFPEEQKVAPFMMCQLCLQVYVWHRATGSLVTTLSGHAGTINAVAWSAVRRGMFASVSDDNTVRIWGVGNSAERAIASREQS